MLTEQGWAVKLNKFGVFKCWSIEVSRCGCVEVVRYGGVELYVL